MDAAFYDWIKRPFFWLLLGSLFCQGCSLKIVPIQLGRVSQIDSYEQWFVFGPPGPASDEANRSAFLAKGDARVSSGRGDPNSLPFRGRDEMIRRMDEMFDALLGNPNWQALKDLYGAGTILDEVLAKKIRLRGMINFSLMVDPYQLDSYVLEGFGRYYLLRSLKNQSESQILLSGDFYIPAQRKRFSELQKRHIIVEVQIYVTRIPEKVTYFNSSTIKYKVYLDPDLIGAKIVSIDYGANHEVYMDSVAENNMIGLMKLDTMPNQEWSPKLIDLRGLEHLRNEYQTLKEYRVKRRMRGFKSGSGSTSSE